MEGEKGPIDVLGIDYKELTAKSSRFSSWLIQGMVDGNVTQVEIYEYILKNFTANERLFYVWSYLSDTTEKILDEMDKESEQEVEKIKNTLKQ